MHNALPALAAYMKRFKKTLRLFGLVLFLLLALAGVSLTGVAPTPPKSRRIINTETVMETVEEEKESLDEEDFK